MASKKSNDTKNEPKKPVQASPPTGEAARTAPATPPEEPSSVPSTDAPQAIAGGEVTAAGTDVPDNGTSDLTAPSAGETSTTPADVTPPPTDDLTPEQPPVPNQDLEAPTPPAVASDTEEAPVVKPSEPPVDELFGEIDLGAEPTGYIQRKPNPRLSPEEATLQAHLFNALVAKGVPLRDQGGVYPYLLRQVRLAIAD